MTGRRKFGSMGDATILVKTRRKTERKDADVCIVFASEKPPRNLICCSDIFGIVRCSIGNRLQRLFPGLFCRFLSFKSVVRFARFDVWLFESWLTGPESNYQMHTLVPFGRLDGAAGKTKLNLSVRVRMRWKYILDSTKTENEKNEWART